MKLFYSFCLIAASLAVFFLSAAGPAHSQEGSWELLGPFGGEISALTVAPSNSRILYAGTRNGKVYRSADAGISWADVTGDFPLGRPIDDLEVDPRNPAKAYAVACDPEYHDKPAVGGLFKTANGGQTWALVESLDECQVADVAIDPRNPSKILVGTPYGIFQSANAGGSWRALGRNVQGIEVAAVEFDPVTPGAVYAISREAGFLRSTNGGTTWTVRNTGLPEPRPVLLGFTVSTGGPKTLFLQTLGVHDAPLYRSLDGGTTWSPAARGLNSGYVVDIATGASPPRVYAATFEGLFISTNRGATWSAAPTPLRSPQVLAIPAGSAVIHAGDYQGLLKSSDRGLTWRETNQGLPPLLVDSVTVAPSNDAVLYASVGMHSVNGGATWTRDGASAQVLAVHPQRPRVAFGAGDGGIWKTTDAAAHWTRLAALECLSFRSLVIDPQTPANLYALADSPPACASPPPCANLKSTDGGVNWSCMQDLPVRTLSIAAAPSLPSTLYAFGGSSPFPHIYKTVDAGFSWEPVGEDLGQTYVSGISVSPDDPDTVYATFGYVPSKSTDGGLTWSPVTGLTSGPDFRIFVAPSDASTLIAFTEPAQRYFFQSTDAGATWSPFNQTGLPSNGAPFGRIQSLALSSTDPGKLFAATQSGIFRFGSE